MDAEPAPIDRRARRAIPLIAAALGIITIAGLLYLRPAAARNPTFVHGAAPVSQIGSQYRVSYNFISPTEGWAAILDSGFAGRLRIYRTIDGTKHWQLQETEVVGYGFLSLMQFFDRNHGFVDVGTLFGTRDGGAHWSALPVPDASTEVTFASATLGWALDGRQIYATSDAGLTWQPRGNLPMAAPSMAKGGSGHLAFRPNGEGWLTTGSDQPIMYTTLDGGWTWRSVQLPGIVFPGATIGGKLDAFLESVWLIPGGGVLALVTDGFGGHAYTTYDAGRSWISIQLPVDPRQAIVFSFIDAGHWWLSYTGVLYATSDAGASWADVFTTASIEISDWAMGPATAIDFRSGWMVITAPNPLEADTGLAMSYDFGRHWASKNVPHVV